LAERTDAQISLHVNLAPNDPKASLWRPLVLLATKGPMWTQFPTASLLCDTVRRDDQKLLDDLIQPPLDWQSSLSMGSEMDVEAYQKQLGSGSQKEKSRLKSSAQR